MDNYVIEPQVDETREFLEIAHDFSDPLDLVREAISNSFDARASNISLVFDTVQEFGETNLRIRIEDDGAGMDDEELQAFFDLGNSVNADLPDRIGRKGHGTKVYFNSKRLSVRTTKGGRTREATVDRPVQTLRDGNKPKVDVSVTETPERESGTTINIIGYNNDQMAPFTHLQLKDHILWFTKFGSIETCFGESDFEDTTLQLQGLDEDSPEELDFGHPFPEESSDVESLFEEHLEKAPGHYCRHFKREGRLRNHPGVSYEAFFSVEGKYVKWDYNDMLRHRGYSAPQGAYTVRERYGLWLCKDYIPIQRKNIWLTETGRGFEFTRFHAFVNCQALRLTANRGSVDNTPKEILEDLHHVVRDMYTDITETKDWSLLEWLEEQAEAERTIRRERQEFRTRQRHAEQALVAEYKGQVLIEPRRETGVYAMLIQLLTVDEDLFPFDVRSYDTQSGIDLLVHSSAERGVSDPDSYFVELKHTLENRQFNHSFRNTHSIVCWKVALNDGDTIRDIRGDNRRYEVIHDEGFDHTVHYLTWPDEERRIKIFELSRYIEEKLGVEFKSRS